MFFKGGSAIKGCNCDHSYQDKVYGRGNRVHAVSADGQKATCTVCGNTRSNQ